MLNDVDELDRDAVSALCEQVGLPTAAEKLGLSRDSLMRVLARQPVRRGTVALLKQALATLSGGQ